MKFTFLALIAAFSASPARADGPPPGLALQEIFQITSDLDSATMHAALMIDATPLVQGVFMSTSGGDPTRKSDPPWDDPVFWLKDIEKPAGVNLIQNQGHKVIYLQGSLDRATQEGTFHLRYLSNGLFNSYNTCDFNLKKSGTAWYVQNAYTGQKITAVHAQTWALGIKTIKGLCKE